MTPVRTIQRNGKDYTIYERLNLDQDDGHSVTLKLKLEASLLGWLTGSKIIF